MKIARAKSKPSRAGGKENQNSIFANSVVMLHNFMNTDANEIFVRCFKTG